MVIEGVCMASLVVEFLKIEVATEVVSELRLGLIPDWSKPGQAL